MSETWGIFPSSSDPVVSGAGGGGPAPGGTVTVGPMFGQNPDGVDADDITHKTVVTKETTGRELIADPALAVSRDLTTIEATGRKNLVVARDLTTVGILRDLHRLQTSRDLTTVEITNRNKALTLSRDLTTIEASADPATTVSRTGRVFSPPEYAESGSSAQTLLGGGNLSVGAGSADEGDLLVAISYSTGSTYASPVQSGWTTIADRTATLSGTTIYSRWHWRNWTSGNTNNWGFTFSAGAAANALCGLGLYRIKGHDPTTPINDAAQNGQQNTTTAVTIPSVTPTVERTLTLGFGMVLNVLNATQTNYSFQSPSGYQERWDNGTTTPVTGVPNLDFSTSHRVFSATGATGTYNMTISPDPGGIGAGNNVQKFMVRLAIAPDPAGVALT